MADDPIIDMDAVRVASEALGKSVIISGGYTCFIDRFGHFERRNGGPWMEVIRYEDGTEDIIPISDEKRTAMRWWYGPADPLLAAQPE